MGGYGVLRVYDDATISKVLVRRFFISMIVLFLVLKNWVLRLREGWV